MTKKKEHVCDGGWACHFHDERIARERGRNIWVVLNEHCEPEHVAMWPEACHEHINEAIAEGDIEGAEKWVVREYAPDSVCEENATLVLEAKEQNDILRERIADLEALVKALRQRKPNGPNLADVIAPCGEKLP